MAMQLIMHTASAGSIVLTFTIRITGTVGTTTPIFMIPTTIHQCIILPGRIPGTGVGAAVGILLIAMVGDTVIRPITVTGTGPITDGVITLITADIIPVSTTGITAHSIMTLKITGMEKEDQPEQMCGVILPKERQLQHLQPVLHQQQQKVEEKEVQPLNDRNHRAEIVPVPV